jgi:transposase
MLFSEGQRNDHVGAALLLPHLPPARVLLADRGYDSNHFRAGLAAHGITACIPPMPERLADILFDKQLFRQRHKIEIMFGRLKDWRRIAMRYDRCAHSFLSAICIAATFTFWAR